MGIARKMVVSGIRYNHGNRCLDVGDLIPKTAITRKRIAAATPAPAAHIVDDSGDTRNTSPYKQIHRKAITIMLFFTITHYHIKSAVTALLSYTQELEN